MTVLEELKFCNIDLSLLSGKKFFITGATGLICGLLCKKLLKLNKENDADIKLILLVRDANRLSQEILDRISTGEVELIKGDLLHFDKVVGDIDYVIHGASVTSSKTMVEHPIEVISTNVIGTKNMLDLARTHNVKSFIYLSSMEAYGFTTEKVLLTEDNMQYLNPMVLRSCYPESKRMAENLCVSYFAEYGLKTKVVRLAQTFGTGVKPDDTRVFAEFARAAKNKTDIILLTDGSSSRMYLSTEDAVTAILSVLLYGKNGEAYNAANKNTYMSIFEMAQLVAKEIAHNEISVKFTTNAKDAVNKFSPPHRFFLATDKIEALGWKARIGTKDMYKNMIDNWGWNDGK